VVEAPLARLLALGEEPAEAPPARAPARPERLEGAAARPEARLPLPSVEPSALSASRSLSASASSCSRRCSMSWRIRSIMVAPRSLTLCGRAIVPSPQAIWLAGQPFERSVALAAGRFKRARHTVDTAGVRVDQRYAYVAPSWLDGASEGIELVLATSGGPSQHPHFLSGFVSRPRQSAQAMLVVVEVARTRYFEPARWSARAFSPPIRS
jgi:hypothetical protein